MKQSTLYQLSAYSLVQAEFRTVMQNAFGMPLLNLPPIRKKFDKMIKRQMVQSHKQVVAKAAPLPQES